MEKAKFERLTLVLEKSKFEIESLSNRNKELRLELTGYRNIFKLINSLGRDDKCSEGRQSLTEDLNFCINQLKEDYEKNNKPVAPATSSITRNPYTNLLIDKD